MYIESIKEKKHEFRIMDITSYEKMRESQNKVKSTLNLL